jgi:hypothetical protein
MSARVSGVKLLRPVFVLAAVIPAGPVAAQRGRGAAPPMVAQRVTLSRGTPEEVGMSPALLEAGVGLYREAVARRDLVGAVLLVARDGNVVLHESGSAPQSNRAQGPADPHRSDRQQA